MSNKKQQIPAIRFRDCSDAWEQRKLKEVANHRGGTAIEKYFSKNGKYKVISIGSYGLNSKYIDQGIRAVSNDITDVRVVRKGELTMVLNDKTSNGTIIGRSLLIDTDNEYVINQRTEILSPKENFDSSFAYITLNGPFREKVRKIVQGGTQIYVNYPVVENLKLELPDLEEQKKIGTFFKYLDDTIDLHQRQLDNYNELKKAMMQKIFTQELRFKNQGGNDYPKWEIKKANEIFKPYSEKNASHLPILSATQDRGLIYRNEVGIDIKYNKDSLYSYKIVRINDFVISLRSFQGGFELSDKEGIVSPAYTIFSKSNQETYELYFKHFFKTENFINKLNTLVYGIRDGKSINFKEFGELKLTVPCYAEQQKIGDFLSSLDSGIYKVTEKIRWLKEQRIWFVQHMFV